MNNKEALKIIMLKLKEGYIFGRFLEWTDDPEFSNRIHHKIFIHSLEMFDQYIYWKNYGSSACKSNLRDLNWTIRNIFNCSPLDFIKKYQCFNYEQLEKMDDLT